MPSSRFTLSRLILLGSVSLTLLAILVYLALPLLLGAWLQHLLSAQDFTQVRLDLGRPGLQTLRVHEMAMTRELGNQVWMFNASNLDIEYRLLDVLKGRIHSLRISQARLDVTPSPDNDRTPKGLVMPIPAHWVHALPFEVLVVENLEIDWRTGESENRHARVRGQARQADGKLHSRWSLNIPESIGFELDLDTEGRVSSALYRPDAPTQALFRADVTITPQANERVAVQGVVQAKFKPLTTLLTAWLPQNMQPIDGSLRATWTGEAPAQLGSGFEGTLDFDLTGLRVGTILQAGNFLVRMNLAKGADSWQWRLHESSRLSAQLNPVILAMGDGAVDKGFVRGARPMIIRAPAGLTGVLTATPTDSLLTLAPSKLSIEQVHTPDVRIPKLNLTSLNPAHFRYGSASGQWSSDGLHLKFTAPTVQPQLAAFGNIEAFSLNTRVAAGSLNSLPALQIDAIDMSLLGGKVSGRDIRYHRAEPRNDFTLEIKGLDLTRVVALEQQQQQQIEATGTLDGKLPFVLTHAGIRIVDGVLHATPAGGVIRYHASESVQSMAATNPNLKLAVQAFSNYHYQKLDVGVNYAENGDLALAVAMAGRNPDWNAGQPINLNINLAENIPMLLRSLRSGDDIGTQFQNRIDERALPKP